MSALLRSRKMYFDYFVRCVNIISVYVRATYVQLCTTAMTFSEITKSVWLTLLTFGYPITYDTSALISFTNGTRNNWFYDVNGANCYDIVYLRRDMKFHVTCLRVCTIASCHNVCHPFEYIVMLYLVENTHYLYGIYYIYNVIIY